MRVTLTVRCPETSAKSNVAVCHLSNNGVCFILTHTANSQWAPFPCQQNNTPNWLVRKLSFPGDVINVVAIMFESVLLPPSCKENNHFDLEMEQ